MRGVNPEKTAKIVVCEVRLDLRQGGSFGRGRFDSAHSWNWTLIDEVRQLLLLHVVGKQRRPGTVSSLIDGRTDIRPWMLPLSCSKRLRHRLRECLHEVDALVGPIAYPLIAPYICFQC